MEVRKEMEGIEGRKEMEGIGGRKEMEGDRRELEKGDGMG